MNRIDDNLWLGDADDAQSAHLNGIEAIVNVARTVHYTPPESVECYNIPMSDDGNNDPDTIRQAVEAVNHCVSRGKKTLVHCRAGMSRSPSVLAYYYWKHHGWNIDEALNSIKRMRPIVSPRPELWLNVMMAKGGDSYGL